MATPPSLTGPVRHKALRGAVVLVLACGVLAVTMILPAWAARSHLLAGRQALEEGRARLLAREAGAARAAFDRSVVELKRARQALGHPLLGMTGAVPAVRNNLRAVAGLTDAATLVAESAQALAAELEPVTAAGLAADGRLPVDALQAMAPALERTKRNLAGAERSVQETPSTLLVPAVADARKELGGQLELVVPLVETASEVTRALPPMLGAHGTRRYFFGAQNPAELRGTGGFLGAYAILEVTDGRLSFGPFAPIETLPDVDKRELEPPNPSYAAVWDRYGGAGFWRNINMTPDFPSAAVAIERLYERVKGQRLDGVILADPQALSALLTVTGPQQVPGVGAVTADTVVGYVTNQAYARYADSGSRKRALGDVARAVLGRFLASSPDPGEAGRVVAGLVADRHVLVHAADPAVQGALMGAGLAGELGASDGDFLAVIGNNAAGNKADFYQDRLVDHTVALEPGGGGSAVTRIRLRNNTPTSGFPQAVIGPYDASLLPGENRTLLSVYCRPGCSLRSLTRQDQPVQADHVPELEYSAYKMQLRLQSGADADLQYSFAVPGAWQGDSSGGTYRFSFQDQPTVRPTRLRLAVSAPSGMQVVGGSPGVQTLGDRAVWEGGAADAWGLEVHVRRRV